jgi:hypothetical protein
MINMIFNSSSTENSKRYQIIQFTKGLIKNTNHLKFKLKDILKNTSLILLELLLDFQEILYHQNQKNLHIQDDI